LSVRPSPNEPVNLVTVDLPRRTAAELRAEQLADPDVAKIIHYLDDPQDNDLNAKNWIERGYTMCNGVLYRYSADFDEDEAQLIVPKAKIPSILTEYHDSPLSGHYWVERTFQRIAKRYFWRGMRRTIIEHISKCLECQRYKASNLKPAG